MAKEIVIGEKIWFISFLNKMNLKDNKRDQKFGIIVLILLANASEHWQSFYKLFMFLFCVFMWLKSISQSHIFS